jgi:hypothetical protein
MTVPTTSLQPGSTNTSAVKQLQDYLVSLGLMTQTQVNTGYGTYGPATIAVVKSLQMELGVDNSSGPGYWGPKTISAVQTKITQPGSSSTGNSNNPPAKSDTSTTTSTSNYGNQTKNSSLESSELQNEQSMGQAAVSAGIISQNFLTKLTSDPSIVAFYVNALSYGGYTTGDVLNDMKRRELASQGNTQAQNLKIIDPNQTRTAYQSTAEGQNSVTTAASVIPTFNLQGVMNPEILKYGANMPDGLATSLVPLLDPSSQEYKDAVSQLMSTYSNLANDQLQADTEQKKAVADSNMKQFMDQIQKKYGITLSNNATAAWSQLENLGSTYLTRGLVGSGLQNEAVDQELQGRRTSDQVNRDQKQNEIDAKNEAYYQNSGTPEEIAALTQQQRQDYGLTASSDIIQKFSLSNLKSEYPDLSDKEIQAMHDAVLDENNNYRSAIYKTQYQGVSNNLAKQREDASAAVTQSALDKEAKEKVAYDQTQAITPQGGNGTTNGQPVGNSTTQDPNTTANNALTSTPKTTYGPNDQLPTSVSDPIQAAIKKIQDGINSYVASNPTTTKTSVPAKTTTPTSKVTTPTPVATTYPKAPGGLMANGQPYTTLKKYGGTQ